MATILFSAVGAALGASIGGSVLGLSSLVIGRAIGATLGRMVDARLMGAGAEPIETGRTDRFRITGASEGTAVANCYGRMRIAGQVIWASDFVEHASSSSVGGGKGAPKQTVVSYTYSVSLALALCHGEILRIGRIWADGQEISPADLTIRVYNGTPDQLPDPKIEAVEGEGNTPAYRGVAYVVIEDMMLAPYGNRVPQLSFEVIRPAQVAGRDPETTVWGGTRGVAMIPGTGDYALATTKVQRLGLFGSGSVYNVNAPGEGTDFTQSLTALGEEMPNCGSVSLVVSWFGDDLRCGHTRIRPMVEQNDRDGHEMKWRVSGQERKTAELLGEFDARPVYGGTPTDQSVIEAIQAIRDSGKSVLFYPFLLMDVLPDNGKPDPWSDALDQPALPWRGRITLDKAPGQDGSVDQSAAAASQVAAFMGTATGSDFTPDEDEATVDYDGPAEWSYRRFILHYAHLCALAGGVDAFCLGSEMRSLTQIRDGVGMFPTVSALRALAIEVRMVLGPDTKIGYAADWSEYFGYHPQDGSGDVYFHLDPLWSDPVIDFVGIDNYMPLSDWRNEETHLDADWGAIYNPDYLKANIEGGEGYDWYYPSADARDLQLRKPIEDTQDGEHWVYRYKDIRSWWSLPHHDRIGGVRQAQPTAWAPRSKPIWFTEIGCPAIHMGTNQPNVFYDARSSESAIPYYSNGHQDELIQARYLEAIYGYWRDPGNNPYSEEYDGLMIDMARAHVWAWDSRPYPFFPANDALWSDGVNYARGHWISGRVSVQPLSDIVAEICELHGITSYDVSQLYGSVRGYAHASVDSGRAALQPLMLAYGFDAVERNGTLVFRSRDGRLDQTWDQDRLVYDPDGAGGISATRLPEAETAGRVRIGYLEADGSYEQRVAEAALSDDPLLTVSQSDLTLVLQQSEARHLSERWLAEARVARDMIQASLPPSALPVQLGEVIAIEGDVKGRYRVDRIEEAGARQVEAVRVEPGVYEPAPYENDGSSVELFAAPVPVFPLFMDLPILTGQEVPHAPHLAVTASPWPGSAAVYSASSDEGYGLNTMIEQPATIAVTQTQLPRTPSALWDDVSVLRVQVYGGQLASATKSAVLNGANAIAIGTGASDDWEIAQFTTATLVAPDTYELSGFLRGQLGTDSVGPQVWPEGSYAVLLNSAVEQISLDMSQRGLERHYRVGPSTLGYDDPSYDHSVHAFYGVGLRPLSPVHLRQLGGLGEAIAFTWIRRSRIDADSWENVTVPLGEEYEAYRVRVMSGANVVREVEVSSPHWTYSLADQTTDGAVLGFRLEVAQISERYGPGPSRGLDILAQGA